MFKAALLIAAGAAALAASPADAQYYRYGYGYPYRHHHHHHFYVGASYYSPYYGYAHPAYSYPVYYGYPGYYAYPSYPTFGISIGFGGYRHHYYRGW